MSLLLRRPQAEVCPGASRRRGRRRLDLSFLALAVLLAAPSCGFAQSLDYTLRQALDVSPELRADESRQEATQARLRGSIDAFMPTVAMGSERILSSKIGYNPDTSATVLNSSALENREPDAWGIRASLNLFDGFKRYNDFQAARWLSEAGRQLSADARQQVLLETTLVYLGVMRDRSIIAHRQGQLSGVEAIARRAGLRFEMRDVTRADLALAQSRVEQARGALQQAEARLQKSNIEFARLTGAAPGKLLFPPSPDALLPKTVDELREALRTDSPKLAATRMVASAAESAADAAWAALSPKIDLEFGRTVQSSLSPTLHSMNDTTVKLSLKVPLYTPGTLPGIEEARAIKQQKKYESIDAEVKALSAAQTLMEERKAIQAETGMARRRIAAMREAVRSLGIERAAGYRTVTDALNAQSELAEALVALDMLNYESDRIGFSLAAALGRIGEPARGRPVASLR